MIALTTHSSQSRLLGNRGDGEEGEGKGSEVVAIEQITTSSIVNNAGTIKSCLVVWLTGSRSPHAGEALFRLTSGVENRGWHSYILPSPPPPPLPSFPPTSPPPSPSSLNLFFFFTSCCFCSI